MDYMRYLDREAAEKEIQRQLDVIRERAAEGNLDPKVVEEAIAEVKAQPLDQIPDPEYVTELLDGIPGAFEEAQLGLEQARRGEVIPLKEL